MKNKLSMLATGLAVFLSAFSPFTSRSSQGTGEIQTGKGRYNNNSGRQTPEAPRQTMAKQLKIKALHSAMSPAAMWDGGVSPKQWGQYLQRSGKQKWTKSKKRA